MKRLADTVIHQLDLLLFGANKIMHLDICMGDMYVVCTYAMSAYVYVCVYSVSMCVQLCRMCVCHS